MIVVHGMETMTPAQVPDRSHLYWPLRRSLYPLGFRQPFDTVKTLERLYSVLWIKSLSYGIHSNRSDALSVCEKSLDDHVFLSFVLNFSRIARWLCVWSRPF